MSIVGSIIANVATPVVSSVTLATVIASSGGSANAISDPNTGLSFTDPNTGEDVTDPNA